MWRLLALLLLIPSLAWAQWPAVNSTVTGSSGDALCNSSGAVAGCKAGAITPTAPYAIGNCGASATVDWSNGPVQTITLNAATCTLTFSNPVTGANYLLIASQDGTGGRLISWPTILWAGGVAPTITVTASKQDIFSFRYVGTSYYGIWTLNF